MRDEPQFRIARRPACSLMRNSTRDRAAGKAREAKGQVKQKAGRALGNGRMETEGAIERVGGRVRRKIGEVEKVLED